MFLNNIFMINQNFHQKKIPNQNMTTENYINFLTKLSLII